jgi:hypothetical protein
LAVPARGAVQLTFKLHAAKAGPFRQTIPIYVDDDGLRTLELTLHGVAEASAETP